MTLMPVENIKRNYFINPLKMNIKINKKTTTKSNIFKVALLFI